MAGMTKARVTALTPPGVVLKLVANGTIRGQEWSFVMPHGIERYEFGKIRVDGREYTNDLILHPDGVSSDWWRKDGHSLAPEDLTPLIDQVKPEVLIIGRGKNGAMTVPSSTKEWVEGKGIRFEAMPTDSAIELYRELVGDSRVMAGLHLTC